MDKRKTRHITLWYGMDFFYKRIAVWFVDCTTTQLSSYMYFLTNTYIKRYKTYVSVVCK